MLIISTVLCQLDRKMENRRGLIISRNQTYSFALTHQAPSNLVQSFCPNFSDLVFEKTQATTGIQTTARTGTTFPVITDPSICSSHRIAGWSVATDPEALHASTRPAGRARREGTEGNVREPSTTPYWTFATGAIVLTRRRLRPLVRRRDNRSPRMCRYNPRFYAAPHARPTTRGN